MQAISPTAYHVDDFMHARHLLFYQANRGQQGIIQRIIEDFVYSVGSAVRCIRSKTLIRWSCSLAILSVRCWICDISVGYLTIQHNISESIVGYLIPLSALPSAFNIRDIMLDQNGHIYRSARLMIFQAWLA